MQYLKFHAPIWNRLDLDNDCNAISDVWYNNPFQKINLNLLEGEFLCWLVFTGM